MIELSGEQQDALGRIAQWLQRHEDAGGYDESIPHFYLGGLAGTGKSTIVRHLLESLDPKMRGDTLVMTPTGKAADVLRKKGIPDACTIHSAIYSPISPAQLRIEDLRSILRTGGYANEVEKKAFEDELAELIANDTAFAKGGRDFIETKRLFICDEFSMVGKSMYDDIVEHRKPLLAIGDHGQLPPVKDQKPPFKADFTLKQIHRQAQDNPIIKLAYEAREHGHVCMGQYGDSRVIGPDEYHADMLLSHDQVICFTHDVRRHVNKLFRERANRTSRWPESGEKLVCKKNQPEYRLFNGAIYQAASNATATRWGDVYLDVHNGVETLEGLNLYTHTFDEYYQKVNGHDKLSFNERRGMSEFDFGYVITCHAAQGSEWDSVLVIDETYKMRSEGQMAEWLYTAITRAAKRVTVYKPRG